MEMELNYRIKDLSGKKFGRLTVLKMIGKKSGRIRWLCKCDCGTEKEIYSDKLLRGSTRSCGYLRKEIISKPEGEAAFNNLYAMYKHAAKIRNHVFNLNKNEFRDLVIKPCHYCGVEPNNHHKNSPYTHGDFIYSGIDRVNNSIGYTLENCVPCCKICNYAKHSISYDDFIDYLKRVAKKWSLKN